jgi:hypothetical protein
MPRLLQDYLLLSRRIGYGFCASCARPGGHGRSDVSALADVHRRIDDVHGAPRALDCLSLAHLMTSAGLRGLDWQRWLRRMGGRF